MGVLPDTLSHLKPRAGSNWDLDLVPHHLRLAIWREGVATAAAESPQGVMSTDNGKSGSHAYGKWENGNKILHNTLWFAKNPFLSPVSFDITFLTVKKKKWMLLTPLELFNLAGKPAVLGLTAFLQPAVFHPHRLG